MKCRMSLLAVAILLLFAGCKDQKEVDSDPASKVGGSAAPVRVQEPERWNYHTSSDPEPIDLSSLSVEAPTTRKVSEDGK